MARSDLGGDCDHPIFARADGISYRAAFVTNDAVAQVIGAFLFFGLLFFGGLWLPRPLMPPVLINISNWTPLGASVAALQNAMEGSFPTLQSILVLATYTIVLGYVAARWFRWE